MGSQNPFSALLIYSFFVYYIFLLQSHRPFKPQKWNQPSNFNSGQIDSDQHYFLQVQSYNPILSIEHPWESSISTCHSIPSHTWQMLMHSILNIYEFKFIEKKHTQFSYAFLSMGVRQKFFNLLLYSHFVSPKHWTLFLINHAFLETINDQPLIWSIFRLNFTTFYIKEKVNLHSGFAPTKNQLIGEKVKDMTFNFKSISL